MDDEDAFDENATLDDAVNWREHVKNGQCWKIGFLGFLPLHELEELQKALENIVPQKLYGAGVEVFVDNITPFFSENTHDYYAAEVLKSVRECIDTINGNYVGPDYKPFKQPVAYAIKVLNAYGIIYRGDRKTFLFWSESRQRWVQIDANIRRKIFSKGQREVGYRFFYEDDCVFDDVNSDLPLDGNHDYSTRELPKDFYWHRKYPWRSGFGSIAYHFRSGHFEPYSQLWHALNIFYYYDKFKELFDEMVGTQREKQMSRDYVALTLLAIADCSKRVGESYDAARKKSVEYETVAYRSEKRSRTKASGQKSNQKKTERILSLLEEIEQLGDMFPRMSEQSIVDRAFENVVGKHPELWKQGKGQKESYLSQHIRSEEPYKSRYYAIFGKTA